MLTHYRCLVESTTCRHVELYLPDLGYSAAVSTILWDIFYEEEEQTRLSEYH